MEKFTKETIANIKAADIKTGDWIKVGMSTCGIAAGADVALKTLNEEVAKNHLNIRIEKCGCAGMCFAEPLVEVSVQGMPQVVYGGVTKDVAVDIINKHVLGKQLINDHIYNVKV